MKQKTAETVWVCWLLPALLWVITWLIGGFHYETNDDLIMSFMARGIAFGQPIDDFSLYFHGFSNAFVWLYQQLPAVAWYGVVLYLLLFIATQLAFWFIYKNLKGHLKTYSISIVLVLFYLAAWYEHIFWFNYMRVPFLLAGLALLNGITFHGKTTKPNWSSLLGYAGLFFLALCIRPGAALLGVLVVLPAIVCYVFKSRNSLNSIWRQFLPFIIAGFVFVVFLQVKSTEPAATYRKLDTLKSGMLDYQWCCGEKENTEDKLVMTGLHHWFIADTNVWPKFLAEDQVYPDWTYILEETLPDKIQAAFKALVFDQFLILALIFGLLIMLYKSRPEVNFTQVIWTQVYFWLFIFGIAIFLKLPPRVLTPAMSLLFLVNLTFLPPSTFWLKKLQLAFKVVLLLLVGIQLFKIANRINWQQNQQTSAESFISNIKSGHSGKIIIAADFGGELRSLSPFRNYDFGDNKMLMLTGWHTLDPHFSLYCKQLTGSPNIIQAIKILSRQENVVWIITPKFKAFLTQYLVHFYGEAEGMKKLQEVKPIENSNFRIYNQAQ